MRKSLYTNAYKRLTDLLIKARKDAGLTQQQVADKLEKPQSFVAKYERGERRLDVIKFREIAEALDADAVSLMKRLGNDD